MENNTNITVSDLDALRGVIDLASKRGAFQGSELEYVGKLFNKLSQFLEAIAAQAKAQEEAAAQEQANAPTEQTADSSETAQ